MKSLIKEEYKPQLLISIYVNADKKIEEVNVLDCFMPGESGKYATNDGDSFSEDVLEGAGFFYNYDIKPDTLYHAYIHCHWYKCSYEYDEWDMELIFLNVIEVMSNYSAFINAEADYKNQEELKALDEDVDFESAGDRFNYSDEFYNSISKARLTIGDLFRLIKYIAEKDIRLAHRILPYSQIKDVLGDKYNKAIHNIEQKRWRFKHFLKYSSSSIKIRMDEKGYWITNNNYSSIPYGEKILITHEQIDNLEDDVLLNNEPKEILEFFYNARDILEVFAESEKEGR